MNSDLCSRTNPRCALTARAKEPVTTNAVYTAGRQHVTTPTGTTAQGSQEQGQGSQSGQGQNGAQGAPQAPPPPIFRSPQTQEEFDAMVSERLRRERNKYADYDDLKNKASELETLKAQSMSEQEKAVAEAKKEAAAEARREVIPLLVAAEFRAVTAGRISKDELDAILEPLDLTKFVDAKGNVDSQRVSDWISKANPTAAGGTFPDLGQGKRQQVKVTGKEAGMAEAQRRFGKPS